ncbi:DNA polymerase III subunit beta [Vallitalea guaymasensis]|uniref:Beta sliding clamp n=1 Tax=Vallitalea guaymasensis TaxID=1185412 RepID=A0A8J8SCE8_9FIRM|nr:DNA polymerase III subunit beta [Vallitalea guaymasensis]QUH29365.1 DNA polymerase III subunit beta [Vallitalea guaymasensis]
MKLTCSKSDLLNGVTTVLKAVSTRTTLPILECILLQATSSGFKLISNDLELGIESNVNANIIETGTVALKAKIFSEIVKKLPDNEVEITVDEKNYTTIICEKSKFNISGQSGDDFLQLPNVSKDKYIKVSQLKLKEMIRQTIFSIALEEIRPILTGELLEIKNSELNIVSLDVHRVSIRKLDFESEFDNINVVVPGKTLNEISKILDTDEEKDVMIYFTDKHVLFELEESIIVSRLLEGDFPKYEQFFSKDYDTLIKVEKQELLNSIDRAALISRETKNNPIKITIQSDSMVITSNTDFGDVYEEIDIEKEGNELEIAFNPKYFIDALKVIDEEYIYLQFTNPHSPCIIKQVDGDEYKYLIVPIRIR